MNKHSTGRPETFDLNDYTSIASAAPGAGTKAFCTRMAA